MYNGFMKGIFGALLIGCAVSLIHLGYNELMVIGGAIILILGIDLLIDDKIGQASRSAGR